MEGALLTITLMFIMGGLGMVIGGMLGFAWKRA